MRPKLNIMKTRPDISEEEIRGLMDFDSLIAKHKTLVDTRSQWIKFTSLTTVTIVVLTSIYFIYQSTTTAEPAISEKNITSHVEQTAKPEHIDQTDLTIDSTSLKVQEPPKKSKESSTAKPAIDSNSKTPLVTTPSQEKTKPETETPSIAYHQAEPENGFPQLYEYFNTQIRYPEIALKDSIQGVVSVSFILDAKGMPTRIEIQNSLGKPFDDEAIRLIQNMPRWKPATFNGKATPAKMTLPITFSIQRTKSVQQ